MRIETDHARIEGAKPGDATRAWMDTRGDVLSGYAAAVECYPQWHRVVLAARKGWNGLYLIAAPDELWLDDLRSDNEFIIVCDDLRPMLDTARTTFIARDAAVAAVEAGVLPAVPS